MHFRSMISSALMVLAAAGCSSERANTSANERAPASASRTPGWELKLGNGTVSSYAEFEKDGAPAAIPATRYPLAATASGALAWRWMNFSIDTEYSPVFASCRTQYSVG